MHTRNAVGGNRSQLGCSVDQSSHRLRRWESQTEAALEEPSVSHLPTALSGQIHGH